MCSMCLNCSVHPEMAQRVEALIRISGRAVGAPRERVDEQCLLFRATLCAYYIPTSVKGVLIRLERLGVPVFDWRDN